MRNRHFTRCIIGLTIITVIYFTGGTFAQKGSETESKKKKLYISSIKANGVNTKLANRVKEGIRLAVFEGFGAQYQVLDDDAIKVMYKQAEAIMSSGCDDTSCITQIADGINADVIVYGEVSQDGTKIAVSITSLERKGTSLGTKSIVRVSFPENQADWVSSETAKKLMNPGYKIDMSKIPEKHEDIKLGGIEVKAIKGLDISVIQFKSEDETVSKIIDYSKNLVAEGDQYFNEGKYPKARARYGEVVEKVKTKLSENKQSQIKEYVDGIHKRIASTVLMEYKPKIEKLDAELEDIKDPEEKDLEKGLKKYIEIEDEIKEIPYSNSGEQISTAIGERKDSIIIALVSGYETSGDICYRDYEFTEAMDYYKKGKERSCNISNSVKKDETVGRFDKKIDATMKTGEGYLVNRVKSFVDQAEFYNFQDETSDAKSSMKEARKLITGYMKVFVTGEAVGYYNGMAEVIKINRLTPDDLPEFFTIESNFKNSDFCKVGMKGPSGGIIFYDKGNDSDGWRYLEAAPEDQGIFEWFCGTIIIKGADGTAIGSGKRNTNIIVKGFNGCTESITAAKICFDYRGGGKNDWFLPSKDELELLYKNLHKLGIGGLPAGGAYWSSSSGSADSAWYQYFKDGSQRRGNRASKILVRAIRAF